VKGGGAVTRREAALVEVAERYGGAGVERAEVVGVRVPRVRLLLAGSSGVAVAARVRLRGGGAAPSSFSSSSSLSPPAAGRWAGDRFPRAATVGEFQRRRRRLFIAAGRGDTWTVPMRREAAGGASRRRHDRRAPPPFPFDASKRGKEEGDDADVGMTQGGPPGSGSGAAGVGGRRGRLVGPANGSKAGLGLM
jgi:hypothetical protein